MTIIGKKLTAALDTVGGTDIFIAKVVAEKKASVDAVIAAEIADAIATAIVTALDKKFVKVVNLDTGEIKFVAKQRKLSLIDRIACRSDRAAAERRCDAIVLRVIIEKAHKASKILTNAAWRAYRYEIEDELREERRAESRRQYLWEAWTKQKSVQVAVAGISELALKAAHKVAPNVTEQMVSMRFTKLLTKCKKHTVTVDTVVAASRNSDYSRGFRGDDFASWTLFGVNEHTWLLQCHGAQYGGLLAVDGIAAPDNTADKVRRVLKVSGVNIVNVKEIKVACCFGGYNRDIYVDGVRVSFVAKGLYETIFVHEMFSNEIKCYECNAETAKLVKQANTVGIVPDVYVYFLGGDSIDKQQALDTLLDVHVQLQTKYVIDVHKPFLAWLSDENVTADEFFAELPELRKLTTDELAAKFEQVTRAINRKGCYGFNTQKIISHLGDMLPEDEDKWDQAAWQATNDDIFEAFVQDVESGRILTEQPETVIVKSRSQRHAQEIIHKVIATARQQQVSVSLLYVHDKIVDGKVVGAEVDIMPHSVECDATLRQITRTFESTRMLTSFAGTRNKYDRYCRVVLYVSVDDYRKLKGFLTKTDKATYFNGLYRVISADGRDSFWVKAVFPNGSEWFYNLADDGYKSATGWYTEAKNGYLLYDFSWSQVSPGQLKGKTICLKGQYYGGPFADRYGVDWKTVTNNVMSDIWSDWCKGYGYKGIPGNAEICETNARFSLSNAERRDFSEKPLRTFAFYCGKDDPIDGHFALNAKTVADIVNAVQKQFCVNWRHLVGSGGMTRPGGTTKGFASFYDERSMRVIVRRHCDAGEPIKVVIPSMTDAQKEACRLLRDKNNRKKVLWPNADGSTTPAYGRQFIFHMSQEDCDKDVTPDVWMDLNTVKVLPNFWDYSLTLNLLNILEDPRISSALSTQIAATMGYDNLEETKEIFLAKTAVECHKQLDKLLNFQGTAPSVADFLTAKEKFSLDEDTGEEKTEQKDLNLSSTIEAFAPIVKLFSEAVMYRSVKRIMKKLNKKIGKLNLPVRGIHVKIVPDAGYIFLGEPILRRLPETVDTLPAGTPLKLGDIRLDDGRVQRRYGGVTEILCNKKDPQGGFFGNVTADEFESRVRELEVKRKEEFEKAQEKLREATDEEKAETEKALAKAKSRLLDPDAVKACIAWAKKLSPGAAMVPIDEITARHNEGWDYDGDSLYIFRTDVGICRVYDEAGNVVDYRQSETLSDADFIIVLEFANRYPKGHPGGFIRMSDDCPYTETTCTWIAKDEAEIQETLKKYNIVE